MAVDYQSGNASSFDHHFDLPTITMMVPAQSFLLPTRRYRHPTTPDFVWHQQISCEHVQIRLMESGMQFGQRLAAIKVKSETKE